MPLLLDQIPAKISPSILWTPCWGKPLLMTTVVYNKSDFEFFTPGRGLSEVFLAKLEQQVLIRDEYRLAYDYFDANANYSPENGRSACYILTGHPGIGKMTFLAWALMRRLSERKDTAVQLDAGRFVLFTSRGANTYSNDEYSVIPEGAWALSVGRHDNPEPCAAFVKSRALVIQASAPASQRWNNWKREQKAKLYILDLWTKAELGALLTALSLNVDDGLSIARKYGSCPRIVVLLVTDPNEESAHIDDAETAITKFIDSTTPVLLDRHMKELQNLNSPTRSLISASVVLLRPESARNRGAAQICLLAVALAKLFHRQLRELVDAARVSPSLLRRLEHRDGREHDHSRERVYTTNI